MAPAKSITIRARARPPVRHARHEHDRDHDRGEHDEVAGGVRHRRHPDRQPDGIAPSRVDEDSVGGEERQRQSPGVDALDVRQSRQRVRVEGEHRSGEHPGGPVAGPLERQRVAGPRRQREAQEQDDVEDEDRRHAQPLQRGAHQRRDDQRFGEGERIMFGIEDVAFEEMRRRAGELVGDPGQDPLVQLGIGVVVARQRAGGGGERPGVDDRKQQAQPGDGSRSVTQPQHEIGRL